MELSPLISGMFLWRDALGSQGSRDQVHCGLKQLSLTIGGLGGGVFLVTAFQSQFFSGN